MSSRTPAQYLVLTLACLAAVLVILRLLVRGSFGRSLKAIRDNETAAATYGKNVAVIKTIAVAVSSSLAAVAGSLYAFYMSFVNVESFVLDTSVLLIAMVIIGGIATLTGPDRRHDADPAAAGGTVVPAGIAEHRDRLDPADRLRRRDGAADDLRPGGVWSLRRREGADAMSSPAQILLETRGLTVSFGGLKAVDDVSLALRAGIVTTLVGPNGAGKTTLFNLITGHLAPHAGDVRWLGRSIRGLPHWRIARDGIGRTFQDLKLFDHMSVLENVLAVTERGAWLWQTGGKPSAPASAWRARKRRSRPWAWPTAATRVRSTSPMPSASSCRWRGCWPAARGCGCSTSRRRGSTRARTSVFCRCCARK